MWSLSQDKTHHDPEISEHYLREVEIEHAKVVNGYVYRQPKPISNSMFLAIGLIFWGIFVVLAVAVALDMQK